MATVTVKTVVKYTGIYLELSAEEAVFLAQVLAPMGGHDETTARKYRDSIADALALVNIKYDEKDYKKSNKRQYDVF